MQFIDREALEILQRAQHPFDGIQHLAARADHRTAVQVPLLTGEREMERLEIRHRVLVEEGKERLEDAQDLAQVVVVGILADDEMTDVVADARQTQLELAVTDVALVAAVQVEAPVRERLARDDQSPP